MLRGWCPSHPLWGWRVTLDAFVSYVQQTFNGLAWSFMVAWLLWVWGLVSRRDDEGGGNAGKCD